jgi:uncharacterized protein YebE (UPF0316 family)
MSTVQKTVSAPAPDPAPQAAAPGAGDADGYLPPLTGTLTWDEATGRLTTAAVTAAVRAASADARAWTRTRADAAGTRRVALLALACVMLAAAAVAGVVWSADLRALLLTAGRLLWPLVVISVLRASDVTLGVFKTTFVVQGRRTAAAAFAASEALVWLTAAGIVLAEFTPARLVAFAVGVGSGTWLGMAVVHRLRLGLVTLRLFVPGGPGREHAGRQAVARIRSLGYGATLFSGEGYSGPVAMILVVARRREAAQICLAVQRRDPQVMVTVDNNPGPGSVVAGVQGPTA